MAVIVYKCDTCKRELEIPQNKAGMETVGRCVITNTCKGKLQPINTKEAFISGKLPDDVGGLDNWTKRKLLYNHTQNVAASRWRVLHKLGTNPSIQVHVNKIDPLGKDVLKEIIPTNINSIGPNETILEFDANESGIAQCISRSTTLESTDNIAFVEEPIIPRQITATGSITIATPDNVVDPSIVTEILADLVLYSPTNTAILDTIELTFLPHATLPQPRSPWRTSAKVLISGKLYSVWSTIIDFRSIPDGAPFSFSLTDYPMENLNAVILLSNVPYEAVDKNSELFLDGELISTIEQSVLTTNHTDGELSVDASILSTTYPFIRTAG